MKTVAVSMMMDEADIAPFTVAHMLTQVDHVIVYDNNSTDGTGDLLRDLGAEVIHDGEIGYYQSRKMTELAQYARSRYGATWIVPFDADEYWKATNGLSISDALSAHARWANVFPAKLYDHVTTDVDFADEGNPLRRIGYRRPAAAPLHKMAGRWMSSMVIEQGNHHITLPNIPQNAAFHVLEVHHFPWRSAEQFVRKVRNGYEAYKATDLDESVGAHWRGYGRILEASGEQVLIDDVYRTWFHSASPVKDSLIYDPVA